MYAGKIVESAKPEVIFTRPKHPYTVGLLNSMPGRRAREEAARGHSRHGSQSAATGRPAADSATAARAPKPRCAQAQPPLIEIETHHRVACFMAA